MKQKTLLAVVSAWITLFPLSIIANACSVCLTGDGDPTADAYNASVLFLMAMPYVVVGSIAGGLIVVYRRAARRCDQTSEAQPIVNLSWNQEESGR